MRDGQRHSFGYGFIRGCIKRFPKRCQLQIAVKKKRKKEKGKEDEAEEGKRKKKEEEIEEMENFFSPFFYLHMYMNHF